MAVGLGSGVSNASPSSPSVPTLGPADGEAGVNVAIGAELAVDRVRSVSSIRTGPLR